MALHIVPISKTGFVNACSVAVSAEHRPSWLLDQPNRLWELDTTWYPGADAPDYLDGSLGDSLAVPRPHFIPQPWVHSCHVQLCSEGSPHSAVTFC